MPWVVSLNQWQLVLAFEGELSCSHQSGLSTLPLQEANLSFFTAWQ